ncbi:MAG: hypothetical protein QM785_12450 [Pyrinomonadaceae bacterium]
MKIRFTHAAALFAVSSVTALGQVSSSITPVCNAEFAQQLVQQQVIEGKSVTEPVKRIKILLRSADFLWKFDEPTARSYFSEAWKMADDRFKEVGFESKSFSSNDGKSTVKEILPDQRMEVVRGIMKRDKEWAKKLADQMLADLDKTMKDRKDGYDKDREVGDLMRLAIENAQTNPDLAQALLRKVMRYPLQSMWFTAFQGLAKNKAFADSIYLEALNAFRNESPRRLLYLGPYPFAKDRMFGIDRNSIINSPQDIQFNEALSRRFLEVFFARIAAFAASEEEINGPAEQYYLSEPVYMVSALNDIEPYIIERFPDLLGPFGVARSQAVSLLNEESRKKMEDREKQPSAFAGTFEDRIKLVEEASGTGKLTDTMIINLVFREPTEDEQFDKIRPWLDKIKEEKPRAETINYFWYKRAELAVKQKRFDDAEKHALKVPELEFRAILFFEMAKIQEKNVNDAAALFETLNRVSKMARSVDGSVSKAQVLLGLATLYEKTNHSTAMDELTEAIRVTNTLKDPDLFKTYISRQIMGKDYGYYASFSAPGFDLEKTFEELSKKDFEISLGQAKSLDDRYFRTLAVIAVATNCAKNAKPDPKAKPKSTPPPK